MTFRIRLIRPFGACSFSLDDTEFSTDFEDHEADALLCEWAPKGDLFGFPGPSAWYTAEPWTHPSLGHQLLPEHMAFRERLRPSQLLHHAHEEVRFRVPHVTHMLDGGDLGERLGGVREPKAAALIRNVAYPNPGGSDDAGLRNAFATARGAALFGPFGQWHDYRRTWFGFKGAPPLNYQGEAEEVYLDRGLGAEVPEDGGWRNPVKIGLFSQYHAAICVENTCEPFYFSEKFVDGVRAGCVPIYRAHATVRDSVLQGARWVDPADFDFDAERTINHALSLDRREVAEQNSEWLRSPLARATEWHSVWRQVRDILRDQHLREIA